MTQNVLHIATAYMPVLIINILTLACGLGNISGCSLVLFSRKWLCTQKMYIVILYISIWEAAKPVYIWLEWELNQTTLGGFC